MKYSSNFERAVIKYEPWAEMPVALNIFFCLILLESVSQNVEELNENY